MPPWGVQILPPTPNPQQEQRAWHLYDGDGFDKVPLGAFLSERAQTQREAFVGARIGLYPGNIDRLW